MDPDSGKLYTEKEVQAMAEDERAKLRMITPEEFHFLRDIQEEDRVGVLNVMQKHTDQIRKKKRKAQKAARKKNR